MKKLNLKEEFDAMNIIEVVGVSALLILGTIALVGITFVFAAVLFGGTT